MKKLICKTSLLVVIIIINSFMIYGCTGVTSRYSSDEAKEMMTKYIENKYQYTPKFEFVKYYVDNLIHAETMGYYGKTTDGYYIRLTDFKNESEVDIRDTKQFTEIAKGIETYIKDNKISSKYKISLMNPEYKVDDYEGVFWGILWGGYPLEAKYKNENVVDFFKIANNSTEYYYEKDIDNELRDIFITFIKPDDKDLDKTKIKDYITLLSSNLDCQINCSILSSDISSDLLKSTSPERIFESYYPTIKLAEFNAFFGTPSDKGVILAPKAVILNDRFNLYTDIETDFEGKRKEIEVSDWNIKTISNTNFGKQKNDKSILEDGEKVYEMISDVYKVTCSNDDFTSNMYLVTELDDIIKNYNKIKNSLDVSKIKLIHLEKDAELGVSLNKINSCINFKDMKFKIGENAILKNNQLIIKLDYHLDNGFCICIEQKI